MTFEKDIYNEALLMLQLRLKSMEGVEAAKAVAILLLAKSIDDLVHSLGPIVERLGRTRAQ